MGVGWTKRSVSTVNPVRNSRGALNPAGIILKCNPAVGGAAEQRGIISNGVKAKNVERIAVDREIEDVTFFLSQ